MTSGERNRTDTALAESFVKVEKKRKNAFFHFSEVTLIRKLEDDLFIIVDDNTIQADGTCVNSHIEPIRMLSQFFSPNGCF